MSSSWFGQFLFTTRHFKNGENFWCFCLIFSGKQKHSALGHPLVLQKNPPPPLMMWIFRLSKWLLSLHLLTLLTSVKFSLTYWLANCYSCRKEALLTNILTQSSWHVVYFNRLIAFLLLTKISISFTIAFCDHNLKFLGFFWVRVEFHIKIYIKIFVLTGIWQLFGVCHCFYRQRSQSLL